MSNSHASLGKRFLSVLLVMVMVIGMLPTFALAAPASGTIGNYNFTYELVPHRILDASTTETTDVDAVVTIYGDGTTAVGTKGTIKIEVGSQSVTVENVRGKDGTSKYGLETTTNNENVKLQEGAIIVTVRNVATGVAANANATATIAVTVTPDNGNPANTVTGSATVTQPVGMTAQHFLGDGALEAAVEYVAPPTPIGKTVNVPVTVKLYSERAASSAGTVENAKFSVSLGNTASTAISMVDYDQQNGMQRNGRTFLPVSNAPVFDINVVWHKNGDDHAVLGSRGFFEWHTTMQSLSPGDNSIKYALDEEGGWYNKNVGSITVHVPTCAVNVPSAVVSTADLVVTYQTEVKNGSVAVVYNGKTFTTGTDVDLSDGVAKITIPKADLDTGWTSLYAVQTTESGVKSVPADATLNFVDEAFDVTFKNGTAVHATQTVAKGGYASRPSDPTALGKKFVGWFTTAGGPDPFNFNTKITESTTVYAHFVPDATPTKDVNFYVDSTVYETQTVVLGGYLSRPTDPVKPGYMFVDWVTAPGGDTSYNFATAVTGSTGNAYAKFASTGASRDVTFYWDDGTTVYEVQHVANGGHAVRPTNPVKAGYEFLDWYTWDPATDDDDGDGAVDQNELETKFNFGTAISAADVKAYAKFKEVSKTYTVTYLVNGKKVDQEKDVAHNAKIYAPADPVVEGYTFDGWYKTWTDSNSDGKVDAAELTDKFAFANETTPHTITADTTLYAKLTAIGKVNVTYADGNVGGAAVKNKPADTAVLKDAEYTIPAITPTAEGYTFKGWKIGEGASALIVQPGYTFTVTDATTITAQWEKIPVNYSIIFERTANDAKATNWPLDVTGTANLKVPYQKPQMTGKVFNGWNTAANGSGTGYALGDVVAAPTANITLYAQWVDEQVEITYAPATLTAGLTWGTKSAADVNIDSWVEFEVIVDDGYDFSTLRVAANGADLNPTASSYDSTAGKTTYTYGFKATTDTNVTVSGIEKQKYTISLPTGENFTAVFAESNRTTANGLSSFTFEHGDTFKVQLKAKNGYTATLYVDGVEAGETTYVGGAGYAGVKSSAYTANKTYDIRVEIDKVVFHTVTYIVDGAQLTTRQVQEGTKVKELQPPSVPSKDGYTFTAGQWYTDAAMTKLYSAAEDSETVTGPIELYGKYIPKTYSISYNLNDPAGIVNRTPATTPAIPNTVKTYNQAVTLSTVVPTSDNYDFMGWALESNGPVVYAPGATFSSEITGPEMLYAVWQIKTYSVTLPSGTGYTVNTNQGTTVEWNKDFAFTITVDRAYAATKPTVKVNGVDVTAQVTGNVETSKEATWKYTIEDIKEDKVVSITVVMNKTYTVTLAYDMTDDNTTYEGKTFRTLEVEHGYKVTQPEAPSVPGYEFVGWMDSTKTAGYNFSTLVTAPTTIYAQMKPIVPVVTWTDVTTPEDGWDITGKTAVLVAPDVTVDDGSNSVKYGSDMTFTVTIGEGWDASKMAVGANGLALAPTSVEEKADGTVVYTYLLSNITENTNITVSGVVRKTVTITYNANARDDVSGMPEQQVVKYYLAGDYDKISTLKPVRTGYEFLGWNTDPAATTATTHAAGAIADFKTDTTLYAIWKAVGVTASVEVTDATVAATTSTPAQEFEGENVTLKATVGYTDGSTTKGVSTGKVLFYRVLTADAYGNPLTGALIGSVDANGTTEYTLEVKTSEFKTLDQVDKYYVKYSAESAEGFADSAPSNVATVKVMSKALKWKDDNKIVIKNSQGDEVPSMVATETYTLYLPEIAAVYAKDSTGNDIDPKAGIDYEVTWYVKSDTNDWTVVTDSKSDTLTWTDYKAGQRFRAEVNAIGATFAKEVEYTDDTADTLVIATEDGAYKFDTLLYTKATAPTVLQPTTTDLEITGADNEVKNTVINGTATFAKDHWAQYEGQTVTLTATVKETSTGTPDVESGVVRFYRYVNGTNDAFLGEVALDTNGNAILENVTISAYDTAKVVTENRDLFYAVYVGTDTYETSTSTSDTTTNEGYRFDVSGKYYERVFIKSAKFQVPVIQSSVAGKVDGNSASETTYLNDLTDLTAGVKITFTLKQAGAAGSDDYSVVALDGRTVPAEYYDIQWLVTTKANESAPDGATKTTFVVEESKATDMYRVKLTGKEDTPFFNEEKHSMYAKTSALQTVNVKVTVEPDWQYQLNNVVLTAEVKGNGTGVDKLPTGTVKFYYSVDGSKWYEVTVDGKNVSDALEYDENLQKNIATITTKDLPVTETTNTRQNLQITAVYEGDNTFKPSGAFTLDATTTEDTKDGTISTTDGCNVTNDSVTIYSSVVYVNTAVEMSTNAVAATPANGIVIEVTDGTLATFESAVELTLSDIYTLDYATDAEIAKLAFGKAAKDYSIEWQYTDAKSDYENAVWYKVEKSTNSNICNFTVANDGRAYRAVVTVEDKPITQGSHTAVKQTVAGRQVYYSNILVAQDNQVTVTTNVNTSNTADGYEGIVEGETVTIHTYVAGAASVEGVANNSVTVTIKDSSDKVVYKQTKNDVLGHTSFTWDTLKTWDEDSKTFTDVAMKPGYYTMTVATDSNNGYNAAEITRQLIIRDAAYSFTVSGDGVAYNGKAQGLKVTVGDMDIESDLAQDSVVVYYYTDEARTQQVLPIQAGTYYATIRLQESAYWTEKTLNTTFTIAKRQLSIEDVIVQAKVYDGTTTANVQEIILKDAVTNQTTGLPLTTDNTGVINGDSVFVTGTAETNSADVKYATTVTVTAGELQGDDAANYELPVKTFTEAFKIQRSQVQGAIGASTYKYTGRDIKVDLTRDIYLIDQQGKPMTLTDADVIYYYHSGNGVKKVDAMNWKGMYTVIARPDQNNYKGGASVNVYVGDSESLVAPQTNFKSALISITNTVKLYDGTATGVTATPTKGSVTSVTYNGSAIVPSAAGRYLVKVTTDTGDTAYGIYTVVKARPEFEPTTNAPTVVYNSGRYDEYEIEAGVLATIDPGFKAGKSETVEYYVSYTGGTIQGVAYEAPTEAGKYIATVHIMEGNNYTAHEENVAFEITEKPLTITADSWSRVTNGTFPDMTATFTGLATGGIAPDTSLRDVQIQPEMIFDGYDNVDKTTNGNFPVTPVAALARNYKITYMAGQFTTTPTTAKPEFAIHGMIDAGDVPSGYDGIAYFGDKIQLYAYGTRSNGKDNTSAVLTWSVDDPAVASITDGLLTINGVGTVEVTLTRGVGAQKISTTLTIEALKKEVKVSVPDEDKVYDATTQTYTVGNMKAYDEKFNDVTATITSGNTTRENIGSQIVTGKVADSVAYYQSETYGGLFTINDKEVTVAPVGKSVQYSKDLGTLTHTEKDSNGNLITDALSNEQIASIRSDYINLDAGTYEILVAGTEDMNYNVKYTTNPNAEVVTVTALENTLKYTTGVIAGSTGRTNGYLQAADKFYPDEGAVVTYADPTVEPNDRMYGEPNPAMNYLFTGLITGDSAADLVELIELVGFVPGIDAPANRAFIADDSLTGAKSTTVVAGLTENYTTTTALQADGVKNYVINGTNAFTHGYQNVYQRPFTLNLTTVDQTKLHVYLPLVLSFNGSAFDVDPAKFDKLLQVIKDNTTIGTYQDKGGLAEKLGHTDAFLLNYLTIDTTPGTYHYDQTTRLLTVKLICTNTNYWMAPITWTIEIDPSVILVEYGPLGAYSSHVYLYGMNEHGANTGLINVDTPIYYEIYKKNPNVDQSYSGYKGTGYERRVVMSYGGTPGKYVAEYDTLSAGDYVMFAVSEHHALIEDIT